MALLLFKFERRRTPEAIQKDQDEPTELVVDRITAHETEREALLQAHADINAGDPERVGHTTVKATSLMSVIAVGDEPSLRAKGLI